MNVIFSLIKRNTLLFFKDKGTLISALIAPMILLALYILFLGGVFTDSFESALPTGVEVSDRLIKGYVAGWEVSSILAVCCVTIAFIANLSIVQDKVTNAISDITIAPVKPYQLALGYFISTAFITTMVCFAALALGLIYIGIVGWYLSFVDVLLIIVDILLNVLFGTALSSIVCYFLKSQGAMSAVGIIVSSIYGFICGAYYPISQFSPTIQNVITLLPGTYGASLFKNHLLTGVFNEFGTTAGFPAEVVSELKDAFDVNLYFFNNQVSPGAMYAVIGASVAILIGIFVLITALRTRRVNKKRTTKTIA